MSLIQAALNRTQNKTQESEGMQAKPRIGSVKSDPLRKLKAWDSLVEKNLPLPNDRIQNRIQAIQSEKRLVLLLGLLVVTVSLFFILGQQKHGMVAPYSPIALKPTHLSKAAPFQFRSEPAPLNEVAIPPRIETPYTLYGVSWDSKTPFAVINQRLVRVGDRIDEKALVKSIGPDSAVLEADGRSYLLKINR